MRSISLAKRVHEETPLARATRAVAMHASTSVTQSKRVRDRVSGSLLEAFPPARRYASSVFASYGVPMANSPTRAVARPSDEAGPVSRSVRSAETQDERRA